MTGMKDQYFGVEVEMTGITREQAAQALADYFGTIPQYKGGVYDAWVVKDTENKEWKLMSDGSIRAERKTLHGYEHYNWTRYYALNLHSVFYRGTVEWRCFNSTLHAGRAAAYINLCLAMSAQAIAQRSTVMRKTHSDNELFTCRVWLVRLGLNGPEFKNTRDHLLANLDGDRAWRYDKDSYEVNKKKKKNREMER